MAVDLRRRGEAVRGRAGDADARAVRSRGDDVLRVCTGEYGCSGVLGFRGVPPLDDARDGDLTTFDDGVPAVYGLWVRRGASSIIRGKQTGGSKYTVCAIVSGC